MISSALASHTIYDGYLPGSLGRLHCGEEFLRTKSIDALKDDSRLRRHAEAIKHAMKLTDGLRQFKTGDEDLKPFQVLGMRTFNTFGAALKLCLSGYYQNAELSLRFEGDSCTLTDHWMTRSR